jgi:hypothetical protein
MAVNDPRVRPDLDRWLPDPGLCVAHRRASTAAPERTWEAAREVSLAETGLLGHLVRWRIPGTDPYLSFLDLFRAPPFLVLDEAPDALVSGLVGRIWTLRRDYPQLRSAEEFRAWSTRGTARVVFAHWVTPATDAGSVLASEVRVEAIGRRGWLGVRSVQPLVSRFGPLIASHGLSAAVLRAERD